jgi:hypothetical protein
MAKLKTRAIITSKNKTPINTLAAYSKAKYLSKKDVLAEAKANSNNKISAKNTTMPIKKGLANNLIMAEPLVFARLAVLLA